MYIFQLVSIGTYSRCPLLALTHDEVFICNAVAEFHELGYLFCGQCVIGITPCDLPEMFIKKQIFWLKYYSYFFRRD